MIIVNSLIALVVVMNADTNSQSFQKFWESRNLILIANLLLIVACGASARLSRN
jgi:hypothetical protein